MVLIRERPSNNLGPARLHAQKKWAAAWQPKSGEETPLMLASDRTRSTLSAHKLDGLGQRFNNPMFRGTKFGRVDAAFPEGISIRGVEGSA